MSEAGTSVEVKRLIEWLRERAGPDSGIDFEAGGYRAGHARSDRCTVFGSDAQFVLKNFHGKGAKALAEALSALIQPTPAETAVTDAMVDTFEREFYADKGGGPDGRSTRQSIKDALRVVLSEARHD